ncbi:MAG: host attachment protein [Lysobacter sp.]|nr:host attachment protein [Lysobacter sp.]
MNESLGKIPPGTMVVVADGEGARVFRNVGDANSLTLQQQDLLELMNMNDDGPSSSPPESTGKQLDEATFAKQLALRLNEGALKNRYAHLVLIADPQTLGRMRPLLHKEVQDRMLGEIAKTLTNSPREDIERALG